MVAASEPVAYVRVGGARTGVMLPVTPPFSVGRDRTNQLCIADDAEVSRQHCIIHAMGSSLMIEDRSRNGTFVDGARVAGISPLPVPAAVIVGQTELAILPIVPESAGATSAQRVISTNPEAESGLHTAAIQLRTDAFLVVDVVDSTRLVEEDAPHFAKLVLVLGRTLERSLYSEPNAFLKCTGDGFLACYGNTRTALAAATQLGPAIQGQIPHPVRLSVALHWGVSHLTEQGDRIGNNVHAVFALEKVRHQLPALNGPGAAQTDSLIMMTEAFWAQLGEAEQQLAAPIGAHALKGLEDALHVYRWEGGRLPPGQVS
jgi:class 3 adenylate cyclase